MTDLNRNTRTLIAAFVVAIFALVPLRFVADGQMDSSLWYRAENVRVLGTEDNRGSGIILPETASPMYMNSEAILEAPYDEIELEKENVLGATTESVVTNVNCISREYVAGVIDQLYEAGASSQDMQFVANSVCR